MPHIQTTAMSKPIVVWGASGHAKVLREFIGSIGYELVAVFDNNVDVDSPFSDVPLFHGKQGFQTWAREHRKSDVACLLAIGGASGRVRVEIQRYLESQGLVPAVAVHPTAFVAADSTLAKGCQILAQSAVCAEVRMGETCIINTRASVDHESKLGDGVHVAPGAVLAGCVTVGDFSMIGAGAVVLPRIKIGKDVIVGAGAVVTRDIPDRKIVYGNPARVERDNTEWNNP
jgi:sugar O-acyltransferase (sialic acid O-acetyltransferase NeuD family)